MNGADEGASQSNADASPTDQGASASSSFHEAPSKGDGERPVIEISRADRFPEIRLRLSDALIVVLVPAALVCAAFIFDAGYCAYFGIPSELIKIDWAEILSTYGKFAQVYPSLYYNAFAFTAGLLFWRSVSDADFYRVRYFFWSMLLWNLATIPWLQFQIVIAQNVVVDVAMTLWLQFISKHKDDVALLQQARTSTYIVDRLFFFVGKKAFINIFIAAILVTCFYDAGWNSASLQRFFLVSDTTPRRALIFTNGDLLVLSPYRMGQKADCETWEEKCSIKAAEYVWVEVSSRNALVLYRKELGHLRVHPPLRNVAWWKWLIFPSYWVRIN